MIEIKLNNCPDPILLDEEDADLLKRNWFISSAGYVVCNGRVEGKRKTLLMHRLIMERVLERPLNKSEQIDHINQNKLDNLRSNLRLSTHKENQRNRKMLSNSSNRFKGVVKKGSKWQARISVDGRTLSLGYFHQEEEAARAYDKAAVEHYKEFAYLNFPDLVS